MGRPKKGKKQEEDWEDDLQAIAAEQGLQLGTVEKAEPVAKKEKKKKRKGKGDDDWEDDIVKGTEDLALDDSHEQNTAAVTSTQTEQVTAASPAADDANTTEAKGSKSGKAKPVSSNAKAESATVDGEGEEFVGLKTAAQKRAEKKEREKQKKKEQKAKEKAKKAAKGAVEDDAADSVEGAKDGAADIAAASASATAVQPIEVEAAPVAERAVASSATPEMSVVAEQAGNESGDEEDGAGEKKKKKKKKKDKKKDEEKPKGKRPGKGALSKMQEQLDFIRQEKERLEEEERRRIAAEEEAERKREEEKRIAKELKERRKQKEKERKDRLRREGKLLSKSEKERKARAEVQLKAMEALGVNIPAGARNADGVKKPVRYGTRQRGKKQAAAAAASDSAEATKEAETSAELQAPTLQEPQLSADESEKSGPSLSDKDLAWDEVSYDESEAESEKGTPEPDEEVAVVKDAKPQPEGARTGAISDGDESSSSDESTDDDDDGEDSSSESDESEDDDLTSQERARIHLQKRRAGAIERQKKLESFRAPVVCVLGHVDTGKTKILDKLRRTHVQDGEAGGITQQIGATNVPLDAIKEQTKMVKEFAKFDLKLPGLLIIDTPGHESFSNLRSRGSSLCDIAILVVDIMHGLEPQTIESLNMLKKRKTPFIVALNKIDRLFEWKPGPQHSVKKTILKQKTHTQLEFQDRLKEVVVQFAEQGMNAALYYENTDQRTYLNLVPTSAITGDGMGDLIALICELSQKHLASTLSFCDEVQAQILEVKSVPGLGMCLDVILVQGKLRENDTIVLCGANGAFETSIRALHMPQPMKEFRVKNAFMQHKEVMAAQGVRICGKDLEKTLAGTPLMVSYHPDEVEILKEEQQTYLSAALSSIKTEDKGVHVQASTMGSLEALLEFLRTSKIPYAGVSIGPVHKKDIVRCSTMLERDPQYAVVLAFDVKIEREAQELADSVGVKIFTADIIYHLFDAFTAYREEYRMTQQNKFRHLAVFPCKLRILPDCVFNKRDPIVVGVVIEAGVVKPGTPLCVPSKEFCHIGSISSIEFNHKQIDSARKGQEVCLKIEHQGGDAPKMIGRHFEATDVIVSQVSRESIDTVKNYFRDQMQKSDWQLMIELKKIFKIL